jgi:cytochrome c-type biogenesis protein CcmE
VELTPRTLDEPGGSGSRRSVRRWLPLAVIAVLVLSFGFLVRKGLAEATLYFRNADEAVAQKEELGDKRFRLQGTVVDDIVRNDDGANFDVEYNGVRVPVRHTGETQDMFEPGIPVVLEGRWDPSGDFFASDRMLIKHSSDYESQDDYDKRMSEADEGEDGG